MANDRTRYGSHLGDYFGSLPEDSFERAPCLFCPADSDGIHLFEKGSMHVRRCLCGLVWNARQPTDATLSHFYTTSAAMEEWAAIKESPDEASRQRAKFQGAVDFLAAKKIHSVLDIGCGNGVFLAMAKDAIPDLDALGTDLSHRARELAQGRGVRTKAWGLREALEERQETWDAITLWGVLEHVKDPLRLLNLVSARLNPGGYVVVCVPNVGSAVVSALWKECFTFCPQHLWYFDFTTLPRALAFSDFEIVQTETIEPERTPLAKALSGLAPYQPAPEWAYHGAMAELPEEEALLKQGYGYKIVAIAQKKMADSGLSSHQVLGEP